MLARCLALALTLIFIAQPLAAKSSANVYAKTKMPTLTKGDRVLLMPINYHMLLNAVEEAPVQDAVLNKIKRKGLKGKFAKIDSARDLDDYMRLSDFANAHLDNVRQIKQTYINSIAGKYDLVMLPSVIERIQKLSHGGMQVDGNRIDIKNKGRKRESNWSGTHRAYSLLIEVYTPQGEWLMTTYGGISIPIYADFETKSFVRKEHLFDEIADLTTLNQGVAIALKAIFKKVKVKKAKVKKISAKKNQNHKNI